MHILENQCMYYYISMYRIYLFSGIFDIRLASKPVMNFCAAWTFSGPGKYVTEKLLTAAFFASTTESLENFHLNYCSKTVRELEKNTLCQLESMQSTSFRCKSHRSASIFQAFSKCGSNNIHMSQNSRGIFL